MLGFMESKSSQSLPTPLLNEHEVAKFRNQSVATLRRERWKKTGPRYVKVGGAVRYRVEDLMAWLDKCQMGDGKISA